MTDGLPEVLDDPWGGCNPLDPGFRADPYPRLARLRERDPVNLTPIGFWRLLRYDDVVRLLRDVRCGMRTTDGFLPGVDESQPENRRLFMLQQDPPTHTRLRKLVSRAFTPRALSELREAIQRVVDECLERVAPRGEMDVIADLALPVPATMICTMLGVPAVDRDRFTVWTAEATFGLAPAILPPEVIAKARAAGMALAGYFEELIEKRRGTLTDDILSGLIRAEEQGDHLSTPELITQSIGLLIAGFETTIGLIGNGLRALIRHPAELARLRAEPPLIDSAVRECLRYDGPIAATARILHEDADFGGKKIPKDSMVWAMLASANRDPSRFSSPDAFDVGRVGADHLAFGGGAHFCLGYHLAELEARAAIGTLVRRFEDLRLESDTVEWGRSLFRVPAALPITFRCT
jgi:cytochrome P450